MDQLTFFSTAIHAIPEFSGNTTEFKKFIGACNRINNCARTPTDKQAVIDAVYHRLSGQAYELLYFHQPDSFRHLERLLEKHFSVTEDIEITEYLIDELTFSKNQTIQDHIIRSHILLETYIQTLIQQGTTESSAKTIANERVLKRFITGLPEPIHTYIRGRDFDTLDQCTEATKREFRFEEISQLRRLKQSTIKHHHYTCTTHPICNQTTNSYRPRRSWTPSTTTLNSKKPPATPTGTENSPTEHPNRTNTDKEELSTTKEQENETTLDTPDIPDETIKLTQRDINTETVIASPTLTTPIQSNEQTARNTEISLPSVKITETNPPKSLHKLNTPYTDPQDNFLESFFKFSTDTKNKINHIRTSKFILM